MMRKTRRLFVALFAVCLLACMPFIAVGCKKNKTDEPDPGKDPQTEFTLNFHTSDLSLFDTLQLRVKNYTDLEWASDDDGIATVDGNGLVTAVGFGTTNIRVSRGEESDSCVINVLDENVVPSIELNVDGGGLSLLKSNGVSDTFELDCSVSFNGKSYDDGSFTYTPSKEGIVSVSKDGVITALDYGTVTIDIQGSWRNFKPIYLHKSITVSVNHDVFLEISLQDSEIYTVGEEIDGVPYSNETTLNRLFKVDGVDVTDNCNARYVITGDDDIIQLSDDGTITASKYGEAEICVELTLDGVAEPYVSQSVKLKVLRPIVKSESTFVKQEGQGYTVNGIRGEVESYKVAETECKDDISVESGSVTLPASNLAEVKGETNVRIETELFVYDCSVLFATHSIGLLSELQTYIAGITYDNSGDDYVILTDDIDCEGYKFTNSKSDIRYSGHFNGQGHAIMNYDADGKGLFGCRLVEGATIENLALYFNAGSASSVALAECAWKSGGKTVYLKNMYVRIVSGSMNKGLFTRSKAAGNEGQCFEMSNVVIDVTDAVVEYAVNGSDRGTLSVYEVYAIGAPTSGKLIADREYNEYMGTLVATQKAMFDEYSANITAQKGFNGYWKVKDDGIYFNDKSVVTKLAIETRETVYKLGSDSLNIGDIYTGDDIDSISINSQPFTGSSIAFGGYEIGSANLAEIVTPEKIIKFTFVPVSKILTTGQELLQMLDDYYAERNTDKDRPDYVILGNDITLPQANGNGVWWSSGYVFNSKHFNGLGHKIDFNGLVLAKTISSGSSDGLFGDIRFSTIENVAIVNAKALSGNAVLGINAINATVTNVYAECDYQGGNSAGLLRHRGDVNDTATVSNCVVKLTNVSETGDNFALSGGCRNVTNCFAIGSGSTATNITDDTTVIYPTDDEFLAAAETNITSANGFNGYWTVTADGVKFGDNVIIPKNQN